MNGVPRCFYELDHVVLPTFIFILTGHKDQVQNNIFVFRSAG